MSFSTLPIRVRQALEQANIKTPEQLAQRTHAEMLKTKNFGAKSLAAVESYLASRGLSLRPNGSPDLVAPEWLLTYERRAKEAGFRSERCVSSVGGLWLSVMPSATGHEETISLFGPNNFILGARLQNKNPRELIANASVLVDALAIIAPEIEIKEAA